MAVNEMPVFVPPTGEPVPVEVPPAFILVLAPSNLHEE